MAPLHRRLLLLTNWYSRTPNYKNGIWPVFFHLSNFIPLLAIAFIWCLSELILWEETILWAYCTYRPEDLVWEAGPKILFQHKKIKRTYKQSQPNTSPCSCPCACGRGTKSAWSHVRVEAQAFQFPVSYIYCKQLRKPDLSDKRAHEEHTIDLFYEKQKTKKTNSSQRSSMSWDISYVYAHVTNPDWVKGSSMSQGYFWGMNFTTSQSTKIFLHVWMNLILSLTVRPWKFRTL